MNQIVVDFISDDSFLNFVQINIMKEKVLGIVRHALTFIGGLAVAKGVVEESLAQEVIGGFVTLVGAVWSIIDKD